MRAAALGAARETPRSLVSAVGLTTPSKGNADNAAHVGRVVLARKSLLIYASNIVGALLGAVSLYFVGRYMTPTAVGLVAFAMSLVGLANLIAHLGFQAAHQKRLAEGWPVADCLAAYAAIRLPICATALLVLVGGAYAWQSTGQFTDSTTAPIVVVLCGWLILDTLRSLWLDTFAGLQLVAKAQLVNFVDVLARGVLTVGACVLAADAEGVRLPPPLEQVATWLPDLPRLGDAGIGVLLALTVTITAVVSTLVTFVLYRRSRYGRGRVRKDVVRSYVRFSRPFFVIAPLVLAIQEIDTLLLGFFWSSTEVGHYYAAKRLLLLASIIPAAVASIFFPLVTQLASRNEQDGEREVTRTTLRNLNLVMTLVTVFVLVYAESGLRVLLSERFVAAAPVLRAMVLMIQVTALMEVFWALTKAHEMWRPLLVAGIASFLLNIGLSLVLVPVSLLGLPLAGLGATGSALAMLASQALVLLVLAIAHRRRHSGSMPFTGIGRQALAGAFTAAALLGLHAWIGDASRFYHLAAVGLLGVALYVFFLVSLRELTRKDWLLAKDLLSVGKMKDYVVSELKQP